jgi:hypothetical protein
MLATTVDKNSYASITEIESVVHGFQWCTLPRERWTHAAHLTVALWYQMRFPGPGAERLIREGIKRFNEAHGIVTTPTGGYHETMTLFWLCLVRKYLGEVRAEKLSALTLCNGLIERYGRSELPLEYYSRERLMSPEARATWIDPDLKTLD